MYTHQAKTHTCSSKVTYFIANKPLNITNTHTLELRALVGLVCLRSLPRRHARMPCTAIISIAMRRECSLSARRSGAKLFPGLGGLGADEPERARPHADHDNDGRNVTGPSRPLAVSRDIFIYIHAGTSVNTERFGWRNARNARCLMVTGPLAHAHACTVNAQNGTKNHCAHRTSRRDNRRACAVRRSWSSPVGRRSPAGRS